MGRRSSPELCFERYASDGTILYTVDYNESTDNLIQAYNRNSGNNDLSFSLAQNFPNPFNPATVISYTLRNNSEVILKVYDNLGKEVLTLVNEKQSYGYHSVNFNGADFSSGIYFYKLTADGNIIDTKRMILIK